jgi:hypothetical protein
MEGETVTDPVARAIEAASADDGPGASVLNIGMANGRAGVLAIPDDTTADEFVAIVSAMAGWYAGKVRPAQASSKIIQIRPTTGLT